MSFGLAFTLVSIAVMIISYLIGSVNFAIIFTNHYAHTDVREHGSGNAGMTNVLRTAGKLPAILTFVCDFAKGAVAVLLGKYLAVPLIGYLTASDMSTVINPIYFAYVAGLFCLLGHIYPVFFSFRGGKGVASLAGLMMVIDWRVSTLAIAIFAILVLITKIVSISSVIACGTGPFTAYLFYSSDVTYSFTLFGLDQRIFVTIFAGCFALLILIKHIPNLKRLVKGEERKLKFGKK
ncbi:MAG: glycerol-3-phosphate 1-O-acyltransferase PlsY [Peptococcaceae bacterium]|nr:glycerol-3-phosphate 1-O-acyltransferase PlsY [Clostridia bacterium]MBQ7026535.1 glycerol-3-phosphate 1-O-acyltransferase PlsY [Peptococcaceae bacterium]